MVAQPEVLAPTRSERSTSKTTQIYQEGIVAGALGAVTIAAWFLILDTINGRPLYTPSVLGTALFEHGRGIEAPDTLPISGDMVLVVTWLHLLIFAVIGGAASRLLALAEQQPNLGFGVVLLFVVFEFGFVLAAMIFAQPILHALDWSAILVGNLLAAGAMAAYFWRRHPHLQMRP